MSDKLRFIHSLLTRSQGRVARNFASRIRSLPAERCPKAKLAIRIDALLQVRAALDATLALLGYDLPAWSLRDLAQDGDGWRCTLSRNPALPEELDDHASGDGQTPAGAILAAMTAARCVEDAGAASATTPERAGEATATAPGVSCEDYA